MWDEFYKGISKDQINHWCLELMQAMRLRDYKILIVTGRGERYHDLTIEWLTRHKIIFDEIFERKSGDRRPDSEVKKEIYHQKIKANYNILFVVDDRASVVKMWRDELKLITLQCDWGDF